MAVSPPGAGIQTNRPFNTGDHFYILNSEVAEAYLNISFQTQVVGRFKSFTLLIALGSFGGVPIIYGMA